jgi:glycosyltransferase involved in cell wall biosynthesis
MPKVSVIITTFNRPVLLQETVESVLAQTYSDFELIVVDNYSNYDFFGLIRSFNEKRIIPFQNQNDGIIAMNRNFGIDHAKGDIIAFCDDDDTWFENKLEKQIKLFENPEIMGVGANSEFIGDNQLFRKRRNNIIAEVEYYSFRDILINSKSVPLSSLMVRKNNFRFSEDKDLICVEDWDYQLLLTKDDGTIAFLSEALIKYRKMSINENYPKKSANIINVVNKYRHYLSDDDYLNQLYKFYRYMALRYLKARNKKEAILNLKMASSVYREKRCWDVYAVSLLPMWFINLGLRLYYSAK